MSASDPLGDSPDTQSLATIRDRKVAFALSLEAWPSSDQQSGPDTSGIACAVVVLRHVLCHFPWKARNAFLEEIGQEAVAENLLLTAALGLDRDVAAKACDSLQSSLPADQVSFEQLMGNKAMKATVWRSLYFRFFLDSYRRASKEERWHALPGNAMPVTEESFLKWDGVQKGTLEEYLGLFKRPLINDTTGEHLLMFTNAPLVLRLVFANENKALKFRSDMFRFTLRIATQGPSPPEAFQYSCAAAVRIRSAEGDSDSVRLYNSDGSHFHPGVRRFPWSNEWKVEDGAKYILFFIRFDAFPQDPAPLMDASVDHEKSVSVQPVGAPASSQSRQERPAVIQGLSHPANSVPANLKVKPLRYNPMAISKTQRKAPLDVQQASAIPSAGPNDHNVGSNILYRNTPPSAQTTGTPRGAYQAGDPPTRDPATSVNQEVIRNPRLLPFSGSSVRVDAINQDRGHPESPAPRQASQSPIRERPSISPQRRDTRNQPRAPSRVQSPTRERPPMSPRRRGSPELSWRRPSPPRNSRYHQQSWYRPSHSRSGQFSHRDSRRRSPYPDSRESQDRYRDDRESQDYYRGSRESQDRYRDDRESQDRYRDDRESQDRRQDDRFPGSRDDSRYYGQR